MKEAREQHPGLRVSRREQMQEPEAVAQMLALARLGWGTKRIAQELGVARNTVKRYVAAGRYVPYRSPAREGKLAGLATWLQVQFAQHRGNCDVVRQELQRQQGVSVSLRTVERACRGYRAEWAAQARATVRFDITPDTARVYTEDRFVGSARVLAATPPSFRTGPRQITITAEGYFPVDLDLDLDPGTTTVRVAMRPVPP